MYYIIQRYFNDPKKHFIAYKVPKIITSKENANIILEFRIDGEKKRKWTAKKDIILLTEDPQLYKDILRQITELDAFHSEQVKKVERQLNEVFLRYKEQMSNIFDQIKDEHCELDC